ncbi:MAG: alpha/beta fold hydrolase [Caulobacteraceae bacterium]|nr:alpha/beta fold hydrolase [Caulobacteraceae bacterium]
MATFSSGGLSIAYDDIQPAGEPAGTAMLIHGFATSRAENWRRLGWFQAFERKGYRMVALDLRGHGESDKPHEAAAYGWDSFLGDVVGLMDHLGLRRVDLMGYSMGAHLSLQTALSHPDRIGNLIVGGVGGRMFEPPKPSEGGMTMAQAMRAADPETVSDPILKSFRLFADEQGEDRLALAACSEARGGGRLSPADVAAIAVPTLVVAGARDQLAGDPQGLADAIPGAKAVTLPGVDHFSAIPHALYKATVFDFLEGWLDDALPS